MQKPINPTLFFVIILVTDLLFLGGMGWWLWQVTDLSAQVARPAATPTPKIPPLNTTGLQEALQK